MINVNWKSLLVHGVIAVIFGIVAMAWPVRTALTLIVVWGIFAIIDGLVAIFSGGRGTAGTRILAIVTGIISVIAGGIAVSEPAYTAIAFTWILGVWLIVRAVSEVFSGLTIEKGGRRWLRLVSALFYLIAGVVFVSRPAVTALGLSLWIGIFAIIAGVSLILTSFVARSAAGGGSGIHPPDNRFDSAAGASQ